MLKMVAIMKSKMAAKKTTNSSFLSAFIAILTIINIGVATSLSSLGRQKWRYRPKYVENGGHFEI